MSRPTEIEKEAKRLIEQLELYQAERFARWLDKYLEAFGVQHEAWLEQFDEAR